MIQAEEKLLETLDLRTILNVDEGRLPAVDGVNISVNRGENLGIVGESGCGKSMLAQSILTIEPKYAQISGEINLYSKFGDRIVFMDAGEIIESASPNTILKSPKTERLKLFLEKLSITSF